MKHLYRFLLALALLAAGPAAWAQSPTVVDDAAGAGVGAGGQTLVPVANCAATSDAVDSGDFAVQKCNTDREPIINVDSITAGDNNIGNVDIVTMPADATELPAAAALGDDASNPTAPAVGGFGMLWDGATWDRVPGTSTDGALVNLGTNNDVSLNAGTNNIGDVDILSIAAGDNNVGNVDVASSALPTGASTLAEQQSQTTVLQIIDDWDDGNDHVETVGAITGGGIDNTVCGGSIISADVIGTPGASTSIYVTAVTFSIGAATASSIKITISGGADVWGPHYLEAISGRGLHVTFPVPVKITANTALAATSTGATTCTLTVDYFTAPG